MSWQSEVFSKHSNFMNAFLVNSNSLIEKSKIICGDLQIEKKLLQQYRFYFTIFCMRRDTKRLAKGRHEPLQLALKIYDARSPQNADTAASLHRDAVEIVCDKLTACTRATCV